MIKWFNDPVPEYAATVLTMGNFDGMHLGHKKLIHELLNHAYKIEATPIILSYMEHPGHFVHFKHQVQILTPRFCKQELFHDAGIEYVYFLNFSSETAHITARDFLKDVIVKYFHPSLIISGYDTHFGYQRQGNSDFLRANEQEFGYKTIQIPPVYYKDEIISSTLIRNKLINGDLLTANDMLGKPYRLYGSVTHGKKIGRELGFPTINLNLHDIEQLIPVNGVYLSTLSINKKRYFGLTNIGTSPTVKYDAQIEIETHILNFNDDIYHEDIRLDLLEYIRPEIRFNDKPTLIKGIKEDITKGMRLISKYDKTEK